MLDNWKSNYLQNLVITEHITEDDKNIKFGGALVYQDKLTDEMKDQILAVYIGRKVDEDVLMPLFRHRENIINKCGTKFNESSWMNFISETNNIEIAENQQCIYNYFSETDDIESLELFEAILAGTNSILKLSLIHI